MIDLVKKFFGHGDGSSEEKDSSHDIRVATCALFLEIAAIDGEFSGAERDSIVSMLKEDQGLSDDDATELIAAAEAEREEAVDLWRFAHLINDNYSAEEKIRIVEMMWRIIYVDGKLDKHEDYMVHKLSGLLRISHEQLIDAKLKILHG